MNKPLFSLFLFLLISCSAYSQSGTIYIPGTYIKEDTASTGLYQLTFQDNLNKHTLKELNLPISSQWQIDTISNTLIGFGQNKFHIAKSINNSDFSTISKSFETPNFRSFGSLSPDGKDIVYVLTKSGKAVNKTKEFKLSVTSLNQNKDTVILENSSTEIFREPVWSPDGKDIYYSLGNIEMFTAPYEANIPGFTLMKISRDGKVNQKVLPSCKFYSSASPIKVNFNPDKNIMAVSGKFDSKATKYGLYIMRNDGSYLNFIKENGGQSTWSPDGKWLAFSADGDIWRVNKQGKELQQLTHGEEFAENPVWSPDWKYLLFVNSKALPGIADNRNAKIFLINLESKTKTILSTDFYNITGSSIIWTK